MPCGGDPHVCRLGWGRLVLGDADIDRAALETAALADWRGPAPILSHGVAKPFRVIGAAAAHRLGVDVETLARVAADARADDRWLSTDERAMIARSGSPLVETACRWVLREAYGKALGVGLDLPLAALTFRGADGAVVLAGPAAPAPGEGWRFLLFGSGEKLVAVAIQP